MIVSMNEAENTVATVCEILGVSVPTITQMPRRKGTWGDYEYSKIRVYGELEIDTVLHELAHHIHEVRVGKRVMRAHNITFHRICFEIVDIVTDRFYGLGVKKLVLLDNMNDSYFKAVDEWKARHRAA